MRRLLLLAIAAGCSSGGGDDQLPFDAGPTGFCHFYLCFDHTLWKLPPTPFTGMGFCGAPNTDGVEVAGTCEYGCRTNKALESMDLCAGPPVPPLSCAAPGTCSSGQTHTCVTDLGCTFGARDVTYGSCSCDAGGAWSCADACADGLCGATAVQAAITGTWRGNVTFFNETYQATLEIGADGAWRMFDAPPGRETFGGGGLAGSNIYVRAQSATGAAATMFVFDAADEKPLLEMRVTADRLQFDLGWDTMCTRFARFDLSRIK